MGNAAPFWVLAVTLALTCTSHAETESLYVPIDPCRAFDTRPENGGDGPIPKGGTKDFFVYGDGATLSAQGGSDAGCVAPKGEPSAVHINLTVIPKGRNGHIKAFPKNFPSESTVLSFKVKGVSLANAVTLKTLVDVAEPDISIEATKEVDILGDVHGYYYPALQARAAFVNARARKNITATSSSTPDLILEKTIAVPGPGVVIATATGHVISSGLTAVGCSVSTGTTIDLARVVFVGDRVNLTTALLDAMANTQGFDVTEAGDFTIRFNCYMPNGVSSSISRTSLTLQYFP